MQIPNLHDSEILDCFVRRLKLSLPEQAMEQAPKTFEDAAFLEEHASVVQ